MALLIITISITYIRSVLSYRQTSNPPQQVQIAQVNQELLKETKVELPLQTPKKVLKVYQKSVKKKLQLPKASQDNPNEYVTDSSVITRSERDTEVSQIVDATTGETTTYEAPLPYPWFRIENRGYAAIDLGYKRNSLDPVVRINVREDLLQVKGIHLGLTGTAYSDGDYFLGAGAEYRW